MVYKELLLSEVLFREKEWQESDRLKIEAPLKTENYHDNISRT